MEKEWILSRIRFFLFKIEQSDDPWDIEAFCYAIQRIAERAQKMFKEKTL